MKKVAVICFTETGLELAKKMKCLANTEAYSFSLYAKYENFCAMNQTEVQAVEESLSAWTLAMQKSGVHLVFIGAMGIAVRAIASGLQNKLQDAPVLVMDELGRYVIPVVGGHVGGANEMALHLAAVLGAIPVITTATDIEGSFAVDLFAKENGLEIYNKDGIAKVSAKALEGKAIRISMENYPPREADVIISQNEAMKEQGSLLLCPRPYAVGIGCKKGTSFAALQTFFQKMLIANHVRETQVGAIASVDLKAEEEGLLMLSQYYKLPFITYTGELLSQAKGNFEESDFVKEKTGVGNVCERAAMLLTGNKGTIIQKKYSENGMTLAIAKME
ncbi:MAG: cobalamin biosynthesis protein [Lachnospiraceae bacterium]|nr:cobalamin biosynthesis protein [Lachnospiraceae bacterium]